MPFLTSNRVVIRKDTKDAWMRDTEQRDILKKYKDKGRYVKLHKIQVGDKVLKGQKATKALTPYNPEHYTITKINGTQIQAVQ